MNTETKHFEFVRALAKTDPAAAFREADLMALAESCNTSKAAWIKLSLAAQAMMAKGGEA